MPLTIYPYMLNDTYWVFDDPRTGLKEEAFVLGASEMISRVVEAKGIANAAQGFALTFDAAPFEHNVELTWLPAREAARVLGQRSSRRRQLVQSQRLRPGNGWLALPCPLPLLPTSAEHDLRQGRAAAGGC